MASCRTLVLSEMRTLPGNVGFRPVAVCGFCLGLELLRCLSYHFKLKLEIDKGVKGILRESVAKQGFATRWLSIIRLD